MKFCGGCSTEKPTSAFHRRARSRDGLQTWCRDCLNRRRRGRRKPNDPATTRRGALRRRYGLTPEEFDAMVAAQGNACRICEKDMGVGRGRHIDHDHATGRVRGLLCAGCNTALGRIEAVGLDAFRVYLEAT